MVSLRVNPPLTFCIFLWVLSINVGCSKDKTIGEGTFGKVKLGTHLLTNQRVAIKILEKDRIIDVTDVERVTREIHILKLIRHPHII